MINTLDELAIKYNCNKATIYGTPGVSMYHGYTVIYDQLMSHLRNELIRILEVGICMEGTEGAQSIRMWLEYFNKAELYTFDIMDMKWIENSKEFNNRVKFFQGDQGNRNDLELMYKNYNSENFDIIIEDGSHLHEHQMISLAQLFKYLKSDGIYFLEDISIPNRNVRNIRNDETFKTLFKFMKEKIFVNKFLSTEECIYLQNNIKSIKFYPDIHKEYCLAAIIKK